MGLEVIYFLFAFKYEDLLMLAYVHKKVLMKFDLKKIDIATFDIEKHKQTNVT